MYPILFSIGSVNFYSYGFFVSLAFIAAYLAIYFLAKAKKLAIDFLFEKMIGVFLVGMIFGHLSYFFFYRDQFVYWSEIFYFWQGLTSFGGIFGGLLAIIWLFRKNFWQWADVFGIGFLIGVFFWRIGCFLTGDHPSAFSPAWMTIKGEVPVPLFESLLGLLGAGIAYLIDQKKFFKTGYLFWLVIGYYGLVRLIVDSWRIDPMIGELRWGQFIGLGLVIIAVIGIIVTQRRKRSKIAKNI